MTALAEQSALTAEPAVAQSPATQRRLYLYAIALSVVNATLFMIFRPGVEDLWAARARASAVRHGVGLTYWFSWFAGGSAPGNYSIITPSLSALLSAELVGALSAVAITLLCVPLLRGTQHPAVGVLVATVAAGSNLWSGRVPFLLGSAFAVASFIAVRQQRRGLAAVTGVLSVFASPVSGAFIALGLAGTFLVRRDYRGICLVTMGAVVASMGVVALVFGNPGPEHFSYVLCAEMVAGVLICLVARPADFVRTCIWLAVGAAVVVVLVPNGMGANLARLAWFYLPVAVVATGTRKLWVSLLVISPLLIGAVYGGVSDVSHATQPMATSSYYTPLGNELDRLPQLRNVRLEVVTLGSHAADEALLGHAMLARGWETQEDHKLNSMLMSDKLNAVSYKVWLQNNAVGFVAVPRTKASAYAEYQLVTRATPSYLHVVWQNPDWFLYRVSDADPIVGAPASMVTHSQSKLTIRVPCACTVSVRVRWSNFLRATDLSGQNAATVSDDGSGWTKITTPLAGTYQLYGTISRLFD